MGHESNPCKTQTTVRNFQTGQTPSDTEDVQYQHKTTTLIFTNLLQSNYNKKIFPTRASSGKLLLAHDSKFKKAKLSIHLANQNKYHN